jgi:hypothetical protein
MAMKIYSVNGDILTFDKKMWKTTVTAHKNFWVFHTLARNSQKTAKV